MNGYILQMLVGTLLTLKIALVSFCIGSLLAVVAVYCKHSNKSWLRHCIVSYTFIFRVIPEILLLFFIYFGLTAGLVQLTHNAIELSPFVAACVTLSIIFSAYATYVFESALNSVPIGQITAAKALGLPPYQIFLQIKLAQAFRHALPGLSNLWLILVKDTAIVTLIGITDLMDQARVAAVSTNEPFVFYVIAAMIYLVITTCSQFIFTKLNQRYPAGYYYE